MSIYGDACKKFSTKDSRAFRKEIEDQRSKGHKIFESQVSPVTRYLAKHYPDGNIPTLNIGMFDIEADFNAVRGYAPTDDPFNAITAISFHASDTDTLTCLVLCPPTLSLDDAKSIVSHIPNTIVFDNEAKLLLAFLDLIEDVNILSGWNSEGYDIPYLVNRIARVIDHKTTARLCLWGMMPREREFIQFDKTLKTYELIGRVHLDYLKLYQKHVTQKHHSYRLDFIGEIVVGENKVPYAGTLDDLYKKDFLKFVEYSRQDVALLVKIDKKMRFIDLANQIAHVNKVLFKTTMGTVGLVETAINNELHAMGFVAPDRQAIPNEVIDENGEVVEQEHVPVVGAYVANPKLGLHEHVGAVDINSLYPSVIRALNMSPETLVGHIQPVATMALVAERIAAGMTPAEAWDGLFATLEVTALQNQTDERVTVDFVDGRIVEMSAGELYQYVFNPANAVCITANGTIFRTDKEGIIPALLTKWYAERKQSQKLKSEWKDKSLLPDADKTECDYWVAFHDQRQYAAKIRLNALYGALLNKFCVYFDARIGQSTTLTGRSIVQHMAAKINEVITGDYDYQGKASLYCDTDSNYFSAYEVLKDNPDYADFKWTRENIVGLYDAIGDEANTSFPQFMQDSFNTGLLRGAFIKAGRELVASKILFVTKKKYACLIYDLEGIRYDVDGDPGKLKVMGLDMKRADTPKYMQMFLENILMGLLTDRSKVSMFQEIRDFREAFKSKPAWEKGSPKRVNNLSGPMAEMVAAAKVGLSGRQKAGQKLKVAMPGHARASINWNTLCEINKDLHVQKINDGSRIIVCKLKSNVMAMESIAYPIDEMRLPYWFKELPFDDSAMEDAIVDSKLMNLVGVLDWNLVDTKPSCGEEFFTFVK